MLEGKKILFCITGSIAAYKSVFLLRSLVKLGAEVKVVMTKHATDFVAPLTFSTLSNNTVLTHLVESETWNNHVLLGRWADVMLIAPASCNTIAKMANGLCDNLLLAIYLSSTCDVVVAPAMDEDMWQHAATQKNIETIKQNGNQVIAVNHGELASGLTGDGRMAEPQEIQEFLNQYFLQKQTLKGKRALVTAGPTFEALDPVRYIGNHSSGKMGIAIAEELCNRGALVTLVLGPSSQNVSSKLQPIRVVSAEEMYQASMKDFKKYDYIVMAAAVADFTPLKKSNQKIKKSDGNILLELAKTKDILFEAGKLKLPHQVLVGFALETENEKANALQKLEKKNADFIIMNSLNDKGAGFGHATNKITIFEKSGKDFNFQLKSKELLAIDIINTITQNENE